MSRVPLSNNRPPTPKQLRFLSRHSRYCQHETHGSFYHARDCISATIAQRNEESRNHSKSFYREFTSEWDMDTPVRDDEGKFIRRRGTAYGCEFIVRVIKACGVERWEDIEGRTIYVLKKPGTHHIGSSASDSVVGIAPLPTEPGEPFIYSLITATATAKEAPNEYRQI